MSWMIKPLTYLGFAVVFFFVVYKYYQKIKAKIAKKKKGSENKFCSECGAKQAS